uniref:Uncharacterized protein n=1 Tax=Meloidogyne enterolobii TaxID=390850 RepID=A0A6V7U466_MELEN|nr:unnamed protein product [Meloidogyne enterolobii]
MFITFIFYSKIIFWNLFFTFVWDCTRRTKSGSSATLACSCILGSRI